MRASNNGFLQKALYGLPIAPSKLARLAALRSSIRILLMIDNAQQLDALEAFQSANPSAPRDSWPIFLKIDVGTRRAGVPATSPRLEDLVRRAEASQVVEVVGFYAHAGHSYGGRSTEAAEGYLSDEVEGVLGAAKLLGGDRKVVVSVGSTPTAHVVRRLKAEAPDNVTVELHAGESVHEAGARSFLFTLSVNSGARIFTGEQR